LIAGFWLIREKTRQEKNRTLENPEAKDGLRNSQSNLEKAGLETPP
jgi:hypothetical protein